MTSRSDLLTSGCVAIKEGRGWRGVYNERDSCPTELGAKLWKHLQKWKNVEDPEVNMVEFATELLKYKGWRQYIDHYIGNVVCDYPVYISEEIYGCSTNEVGDITVVWL